MAATTTEDIPADARRAVRDRLYDGRLLEKCVHDVRRLLSTDDDSPADAVPEVDVVYLWDESSDPVAGGSGYGTDF